MFNEETLEKITMKIIEELEYLKKYHQKLNVF